MDKISDSLGSILLAGASGFLGRSLTNQFIHKGFKVVSLSRSESSSLTSPTVSWNPSNKQIDIDGICEMSPNGFTAVINLAGENLGSKRWSNERMRDLRESRINSTRLLASNIDNGSIKTRLFLSASATGYYGDRGDEILTEDSKNGKGYLAELCRDWENSAELKTDGNVRLVFLRTGLVLDAREGALARMLPIFKMGIGGKLGSGNHFYPWITLTDFLRAVLFVLENSFDASPICGAVNLVSPNPVQNSKFTDALASALKRPAVMPVPRFVLNIALGQIANEALLTSQRAIPKKLLDSGFEFKDTDIDEAMKAILIG